MEWRLQWWLDPGAMCVTLAEFKKDVAKVQAKDIKSPPLIDELITTIQGEDGICYTHRDKLPGAARIPLSWGRSKANVVWTLKFPIKKVILNLPIFLEIGFDFVSRRWANYWWTSRCKWGLELVFFLYSSNYLRFLLLCNDSCFTIYEQFLYLMFCLWEIAISVINEQSLCFC